jgi:hypothetical protein
MNMSRSWVALAALIGLARPAGAAAEIRAEPPGGAASASTSTSATSDEPSVQRIRIEDDAVRIDELRVRGLTRKISVKPKLAGAKAYDIVPGAAGSDPSLHRDSTGQRVWNLFSF